ncbi:biopolymer transport protein ExbD [Nitrosomonas sp. Nm51]|uniref:ExbD/TolR family protein n=1 Tax=Nitrosomonas sp. Nm51 TaxID=133720 RepID=UPI0008D6249B|nr:biopolymer transporter ExbD [Nitrosomonas sp. Nm51]SER58895.1 biopolymer transport protein ExbD [Nitrosomonas sp. Nm51]
MEFETRKRVTPNINLAALVDVVFILVIFIVLGANFHRIQTLDVSIPVAESTGQADSRSLVITIPASGQLDLLGKKIDPENLKSALRAKVADFESVLLVADQSAPVQRVVQILSDAQVAGFVSVSIATQEPE